MRPLTPAIVFADIDNLPPRPAADCIRLAAVLEKLAADRIALVFCSYRTRAEIESVRHGLGVYHPFVCENGSAAFVPGRYFGSDPENARLLGGYHAIEFAQPYERATEIVRRAADRLSVPVQSFGQMSVEDVARECGLSLLDARLAKLREYAEPFRPIVPNRLAERRLVKALEHAGLKCSWRGGFHYAGTASGPGAAAAVLTTLYRMSFGSVMTAVLGGGGMVADIAPRVDVRLASSGVEPMDPLLWLERVIQDVDSMRRARPLWPAARQAR